MKNVSKCANPECKAPFKRLGEGKLFVRPAQESGKGMAQKALWLCPECALHFDLHFDRQSQEYQIVRRRHVA